MSLAKVIEVMSEGKTVEDALENAIQDASKTVKNIKGAYIENSKAIIENNKIVKYRINAKLTFVLDDTKR